MKKIVVKTRSIGKEYKVVACFNASEIESVEKQDSTLILYFKNNTCRSYHEHGIMLCFEQ